MSVLTKEEHNIITMYYLDDLMLSEVATILGITKQRVSQIKRLAVNKMQDFAVYDKIGCDTNRKTRSRKTRKKMV